MRLWVWGFPAWVFGGSMAVGLGVGRQLRCGVQVWVAGVCCCLVWVADQGCGGLLWVARVVWLGECGKIIMNKLFYNILIVK